MSLFLNVEPQEFLPAGKYFVGDPCYFVPNEEWDNFCDTLFTTDDTTDTKTITILDYKCQCQHTMYGDGSYRGDNGLEYDVDAGLLGAVPEVLCNTVGDYEKRHLITFKEPFAVVFDDESESILFVNEKHSVLLSIFVGQEEEDEEDSYWLDEEDEEDEDEDEDEDW